VCGVNYKSRVLSWRTGH